MENPYPKYMIWRGGGTRTSKMSQLGEIISENNENPRFMSEWEIDRIINRKKSVCIWYYFPIRTILEIMARNGKIDGKYINKKIGWVLEDIDRREIQTEHKLEWKVDSKCFDKFRKDLIKIRNYRLYYTDRQRASDNAVQIAMAMLTQEEWTMNEYDGYVKLTDLWNEYQNNCKKTKNLEFRIQVEKMEKTKCEIPLVVMEDKDLYETKKCNPGRMFTIENEWENKNMEVNLSRRRKRKRKECSKELVDGKKIRFGNEEILEHMKEIKMMIASMKNEGNDNGENLVLDKADQLYEIERTVYDEEIKEVFKQIVLSRKDYNDLPYKMLEEDLLTGANFMIQMPEIEKVRNNMIGMLQTMNEMKTEKWNDNTLAERLQKIAGNRMKAVIQANLRSIMNEMIQFKKELEIANDLKAECETKNDFNVRKFADLLADTVGQNHYGDKRVHYLERWTEEIEKNLERGMKKKKEKETKNERSVNEPKMVMMNPLNKVSYRYKRKVVNKS